MADYFESKYTGSEIEALLDKVDGLDAVEGNPIEGSSVDLIKIKIGENVYLIPPRMSVVVNGAGTPVATAEKISVNGVTFSIPQQGGGTSGTKYLHSIALEYGTMQSFIQIISNTPTPVNNDSTFSTLLVNASGVNNIEQCYTFCQTTGHPDRPDANYDILIFSSTRDGWVFDGGFVDVTYQDTVSQL